MSDLKDEKKVEIKNEGHEKTEEKPENKGEIQLRSHYRPMSIFKEFDSFFDEIDQYFTDFWKPRRFHTFEPFSLKIFDDDKFFRSPLTNIKDEGDHFSITAEIPGLDKGDIEITVMDGKLEIKGEQKVENEEKKEGYVRREYSSSSYYRSFNLPENINENKIEANLDKGLLKLVLPKIEEEKKEKKSIEVK